MAEESNHWTIIAATDAGDEASISAHPGETLKALLVRAVHELFGGHANPEAYEVLIAGAKAENLELSLEQAGLHDGSEVIVQKIDMHRG